MKSVVVWGLGQLGGVFSHGFLRLGYPVFPITRETSLADGLPEDPRAVLISVGEKELSSVLALVPPNLQDRVILVQNEILPPDYAGFDATVSVVWFEKKPGTAATPILSTPTFGPQAEFVTEALRTLDLPAQAVDPARGLSELISKNLYILTANIGGLSGFETVGELSKASIARKVFEEAARVQEARLGTPIPLDEHWERVLHAFAADPTHKAAGRSAPHRLHRAISVAKEQGIPVPTLLEISASASL